MKEGGALEGRDRSVLFGVRRVSLGSKCMTNIDIYLSIYPVIFVCQLWRNSISGRNIYLYILSLGHQ